MLRPADSAETVEAYKLAMYNQNSPTVLIFSRQDLEDLPGDDRRKQAEKASRGGHVVVGVSFPTASGSSDSHPDFPPRSIP